MNNFKNLAMMSLLFLSVPSFSFEPNEENAEATPEVAPLMESGSEVAKNASLKKFIENSHGFIDAYTTSFVLQREQNKQSPDSKHVIRILTLQKYWDEVLSDKEKVKILLAYITNQQKSKINVVNIGTTDVEETDGDIPHAIKDFQSKYFPNY